MERLDGGGLGVDATTLLTRLRYSGERNGVDRFVDLVGALPVATSVLIDIKLHTGAMSERETVRFMVEERLQEPAVAAENA